MNRLFLLFGTLLFTIVGNSKDLKEIIIIDNFEPLYVGAYSAVYEDTSQSETFPSILLQPDSLWHFINTPIWREKVNSSNFWIKFRVTNPTDKEIFITQVIENAALDRVQFFCLQNHVLVDSSQQMGDILPFPNRVVQHPHYIYANNIPAKSTYTFYCLVEKQIGTINVPIKLYKYPQLISALQHQYLKLFLFGSFPCFIVVIGCFFFLFTGDRLALLFTFQALSIVLFILGNRGLGFQFLWPNNIAFQQEAVNFFIMSYLLFQILTIKELFKIQLKSKVGKLILGSILIYIFCLSLIILSFSFDTLAFMESYKPYFFFYNGLLFGILLNFFAYLKIYWHNNNNEKIWLIIIFLPILFLSIWGIINWLSGHRINQKLIFDYIAIQVMISSLILLILLVRDYKTRMDQNKNLQLDIVQNQNQALKNLLIGQETERKRLSQELHDGLSIRVSQFKQQLANQMKGKKTTPNLLKDIDLIHEDIRLFSHALNPFLLSQLGLKKSIDNIIFKLESNFIDLDIQFNYPDSIALNKEQEKHFYHIIQELVNNTIKYAKANQIEITFQQVANTIKLIYSDNGIGYDPRAINQKGIGINNIQSRVQLLKGTFSSVRLDPTGMEHQIILSN